MLSNILNPILRPILSGVLGGGGQALTYEQMVLVSSPVRYYRLGETSGTAIVDEISAKNGVYIGPYTLGEPSLLASGDDLSVDWNGSADPTLPQDSDFNVGTGDFTVMFLIQFSSATDSLFIFDTRHADNVGYFILIGGFGGSLSGGLRYTVPFDTIEAVSTTVINDGGIYHCVVRRESGTVTVWVDGVNEDSATDSASYTRATGSISLAHASFGGARIDAKMDELCYYNKALTNSEISAFSTRSKQA